MKIKREDVVSILFRYLDISGYHSSDDPYYMHFILTNPKFIEYLTQELNKKYETL